MKNKKLLTTAQRIGTILLELRPSSFFSPFSVVWPTQIFGIFKKKKVTTQFGFFFFQSNWPAQYQKMHSTLNEKKGMA